MAAKKAIAKPAGATKVKTVAKKPAVKKAAAVKAAKTVAAKPVVAPAGLTEGAKAPAFKLPRDGGATISLDDYKGRKLVIFFYPRASTPGCTREAMDFTRLAADFEATGTAVLGVSADSQKAQEKFRDKFELGVPLLSDTTQAMLSAYGAWGEKTLYGKVYEGVLRTTVLVGANGKVAKVWRNVKVDGHADAVLAEAKQL